MKRRPSAIVCRGRRTGSSWLELFAPIPTSRRAKNHDGRCRTDIPLWLRTTQSQHLSSSAGLFDHDGSPSNRSTDVSVPLFGKRSVRRLVANVLHACCAGDRHRTFGSESLQLRAHFGASVVQSRWLALNVRKLIGCWPGDSVTPREVRTNSNRPQIHGPMLISLSVLLKRMFA